MVLAATRASVDHPILSLAKAVDIVLVKPAILHEHNTLWLKVGTELARRYREEVERAAHG